MSSSTLARAGNPTLHLGVLVQPYATPPAMRKGKARKPMTITTADVAQFLEDKYGVMCAYYRVHQKDVTTAIESSVQGALEALVMGQVVDPWGSATQKIESGFREFINSKEAERVGIPGTPTQAALNGVNHRLRHPYAKRNPRRPSFRDTGLYVTSFRAWVE